MDAHEPLMETGELQKKRPSSTKQTRRSTVAIDGISIGSTIPSMKKDTPFSTNIALSVASIMRGVASFSAAISLIMIVPAPGISSTNAE